MAKIEANVRPLRDDDPARVPISPKPIDETRHHHGNGVHRSGRGSMASEEKMVSIGTRQWPPP